MNQPLRPNSTPRPRAAGAIIVLLVAYLLCACGGGDRRDGTAAAGAVVDSGSGVSEDAAADGGQSQVDYGNGPVSRPNPSGGQLPIEMAAQAAPSGLMNGGPTAGIQGAFGPAFPMPLIPVHMVMLPDGRLLAYGSDDKGVQSALLHYMVYDPEAAGYPFLVLPNTTQTDLFCSTQTLLPQGRVMLAGGDRIANGLRNYANADVNIFDPVTGKLELQQRPMAYRRWYATGLITAEGEHLVLGGRDDLRVEGVTTETFSTTPEIYNPVTGWHTLRDAQSDAAFGKNNQNWLYPKAWVGPNGRIAIVTNGSTIFQLEPAGRGSIQPWNPASGKLTGASPHQPAVMFKPGKILAARNGTGAQVIDINGVSPAVQDTSPLHARRIWGSMTLLPDGRVWANGGSTDGQNELAGAVYSSELWNPVDGAWTLTATATKPRLYHGNSILLRDGRVLTGGGGAPGPVAGLNAEIFYPPYLFKKDGSGQLATRPVVASVSTRSMPWSAQFTLRMSTAETVGRVVIVRTGSATHAFNGDQRLIELPLTQNGRDLSIRMPTSRNGAPPGYYMVFVLSPEGVPSVGEIIKLG